MGGTSLSAAKREWDDIKAMMTTAEAQDPKKSISDRWAYILTSHEEIWRIIPNLVRIIEIILITPLSSVPCERAASLLKRVITDHRTTLSSSKVDNDMYIAFNGAELHAIDIVFFVKKYRKGL